MYLNCITIKNRDVVYQFARLYELHDTHYLLKLPS